MGNRYMYNLEVYVDGRLKTRCELGICIPLEITKSLSESGATLSSVTMHPLGGLEREPDHWAYLLTNVSNPFRLKRSIDKRGCYTTRVRRIELDLTD